MAFATVQSTWQSVKNYRDYNMFGTNDGVFDRLVERARLGGVVFDDYAQEALDFWTDRYGGPNLFYTAGESTTIIKLALFP
jgi:hypothetical protein